MKHGDKAKAKSAKAKASGKDVSSKKADAKSSKGAEKASSKGPVKAAGKKDSSSKAEPVKKASPSAKGDNGKGKAATAARVIPGPVNFSNSAVGEAFRRAIKKYPNAFRRLTD